MSVVRVVNKQNDREKLLRFVDYFGQVIDGLYYKDGKIELLRYLSR